MVGLLGLQLGITSQDGYLTSGGSEEGGGRGERGGGGRGERGGGGSREGVGGMKGGSERKEVGDRKDERRKGKGGRGT